MAVRVGTRRPVRPAIRLIPHLAGASILTGMRRLIVALVAPAFALPMLAGPASAAAFQSCSPVKIPGYPKLAIKVKVKGITCADASTVWVSYISTGEALQPPLEDLRTKCKDGSKAARKKAAKVGRLAIVCRNGKVVTKAWAMGG